MRFPLIHKERDYGVSFPDFPGCVTAGADLDAVPAEEALAFHVDGLAEEGEPLPGRSTLEGRSRRTATGWRSWFRWRMGDRAGQLRKTLCGRSTPMRRRRVLRGRGSC